MRLIDTHCHLDAPEFDPDRAVVLDAAHKAGVGRIVIPAVTRQSWSALLEICQNEETLFPALGLHPVYLAMHSRADLAALERALEDSPPVAIGEIGLDYYLKELVRKTQRDYLDAQLSIACAAGLPVILHCRKAYDDLITLLEQHKSVGGIAHAFNGSIQQAHKLIDLGFKLGFGGMLTYTRSIKLTSLAARLPLEALVLETDAPDMTVHQHRGERNSPAYLPYVLSALAEARGEPVDEIAQQVYLNSCEVFSFKS